MSGESCSGDSKLFWFCLLEFLFSAVSFWKVSPLYMLFIVVFYPSIYVVVSTLPRSLQDS